MYWSYGVTTFQTRLEKELPQTLASLAAAGFDQPRLFVDGCEDPSQYARFGLQITSHWPTLRTFCNWFLAINELAVRDPHAERYAIFQDDCLAYRNLRGYLEACEYPEKGYLNLYTWPENQHLFIKYDNCEGWMEAGGHRRGLGAVGLVFSREAVLTLLGSQYMLRRPENEKRGWQKLDGGIVEAMNLQGWAEYVHNPSLIQHIGFDSTMAKKKLSRQAISFRGEDYDALQLIEPSACP